MTYRERAKYRNTVPQDSAYETVFFCVIIVTDVVTE